MSLNLESIYHDLQNIRASRYTCGAGMAVMFYDYFLTLPDVSIILSFKSQLT
jgi:hypothetical protein